MEMIFRCHTAGLEGVLQVSTPNPVLPELALLLLPRVQVTAPADVFSAAVVVAEMLNHAPPWQGCHPMGVVFQLVFLGRRPHISDRHCPTSLRQLLLSCMRRQPCECPSTVEVLEQQQCIGDGLGSPKYAGN